MKCCSHSTLGVIIGILNVLGYFIGIVSMIFSIAVAKDEIKFFSTIGVTIILCLIMMSVSIVLVIGIIKRQHNLMLPWLILSAIGFLLNSIFSMKMLIFNISYSHPWFLIFFGDLLGIGVSGVIIWLIYTLFRDMRNQNLGKGAPVHYQI